MKSVINRAIKMARQDAASKFEAAKASQPKPEARQEQKESGLKGKRKSTYDDDELRALLEASKAKIRVVGCGGGGCNTINRMTEVGILGAETVAVNTDAQDLLKVRADRKVLIGKKLTRGLGAGSDPNVGEASAQESVEELQDIFADADLVFITCGMGGGTGTGSAPVVAELVKKAKALTIGVVTIPFTVEGRKRMENAMRGIENIRKHADTLIVIPNDKILEIAPDLPVNAAFKVADEVLTNAVKGITEMITKPGLINLDFADLRTILSKGGAAMIGLGESSTHSTNSDSRALEAVENALTSPLLDVDISNANRALINVVGGSDMTLREAELIVEAVSSKISNNAHIIWGAMIDDTLPKNQIQAMVVIAGGRFPYLDGDVNAEGEVDLGIKFTG